MVKKAAIALILVALLAGCHREDATGETEPPASAATPTPAPSSTSAAATTQTASLHEAEVRRRAIEAANWGMPIVNYDLMRQQMLGKTQGKVGEFIFWGRPLDWHNQTLTPNPDTIYFMTFFNTKDGPVVLEIPKADGGSLNANIVTAWQQPLEDGGLLGIDKGAGAKFLLIPPGYDKAVPKEYVPLRMNTYGGYALLRSNLKSHAPADVAASIDYAKRAKIYPLSQAANPPATKFTDVQDVDFDSTIRYDASFFENLDRVVQEEPWLDRDRAMVDVLRSVGIEKGKPFAPDEATRRQLDEGMKEAHAWLEARYDAGWPPFFDGGHWRPAAPIALIRAAQAEFNEPDAYPVDTRGMVYTYGYIGIKRLGAGQFYLIGIKDKDGNALDGGKTYRLHVPPNVPVEQYWSLTAYDRETHALIKGMDRASRASNVAEVKKNPDGSIDIYLGPTAPAGEESNWIPTDPKRPFELMFRLYGPTKALFDKAWTLPDVEMVQ